MQVVPSSYQAEEQRSALGAPTLTAVHRGHRNLQANPDWRVLFSDYFGLGITNKTSYRDLVIITAYFYLTVRHMPLLLIG